MTAGVRLDIEIDDRRARAALGRLGGALADPRPMLGAIGARLAAAAVRRFETETGPDGVRWRPSRRALETGGRTLTDTARLRRSITQRVGADRVEIGTDLRYAAVHQFGAPERGIPPRPFLGIDAGDRRALLGIAARHLETTR